MKLYEAKKILKSVGYRVINEKEINLNYLLKDIFELLTSFGISATDDEVERLMWAYINSGRKPENSNAEDILEFDIDNAPDTIIDYTSDFVDWIKRGQYKTGPVDESVQMNEAINNPDEPATSRQLWALFCMTKKDYRGKGLTKQQASDLIGELKSGKKIENSDDNKTKNDDNALVKVGDIYHRQWGYDMTINTYYKVLMVRGKKATVVELGKKVISGSLQQGKVVPDEKNRETKTTIALIKPDGSLRIRFMGDGDYGTYHKWDGKPDYEDHMD